MYISLYGKCYIFIWKMLKGEMPEYLTGKLTLRNEIHEYNTRHNTLFDVELRRTVNAKKTYFMMD